MCTLSWLPSRHGYTVWFNRDERVTRARGIAPERGSQHGVAFIAPQDGEAGGTWIGANALGVTVCLANRYHDGPGATVAQARARVSRGRLVPSLLGSRNTNVLSATLKGAELEVYEPFTVAAFAVGAPAHLLAWNGAELTSWTESDPGIILTSSAVDQMTVAQARHTTLAAALAQEGNRLMPAVLDRLHASHIPSPSGLSVCMHREDARTVSLSRVEVGPDTIRFQYTPGPPCSTPANEPVTLTRVAAASAP